MSREIEFERNEMAEIIASSFDHDGEKWDASDFELSAHQLQRAGFHRQSKHTIDLLEKQLAFWKGHATSLTKALDEAEKTAQLKAELLDKTEEELNGNGNQSEGEWIVTDADSGSFGEYEPFIEFKCPKCESSYGIESGQYDWQYGEPIPWVACPLCGAKMKGGAE